MVWLDDVLVYATNFEDFISVLRYILQKLIKFGVRLNAQKSTLLTTEVQWCGRRINRKGWNFMPVHFNKILRVPMPSNVAELENMIYVLT